MNDLTKLSHVWSPLRGNAGLIAPVCNSSVFLHISGDLLHWWECSFMLSHSQGGFCPLPPLPPPLHFLTLCRAGSGKVWWNSSLSAWHIVCNLSLLSFVPQQLTKRVPAQQMMFSRHQQKPDVISEECSSYSTNGNATTLKLILPLVSHLPCCRNSCLCWWKWRYFLNWWIIAGASLAGWMLKIENAEANARW